MYHTGNCKVYYDDQTPPFAKTPPSTCAEGSFAVAPFLTLNHAFNLSEVATCYACEESCNPTRRLFIPKNQSIVRLDKSSITANYHVR